MTPVCQSVQVPPAPSLPEQVDGDITLYTPEMLKRLFGVDTVEQALAKQPSSFCAVPPNMGAGAIRSIQKTHHEKLGQQAKLAQLMPIVMPPNIGDRENLRRFYLRFGVDVVQARLLGAKDTEELNQKIMDTVTKSRA